MLQSSIPEKTWKRLIAYVKRRYSKRISKSWSIPGTWLLKRSTCDENYDTSEETSDAPQT